MVDPDTLQKAYEKQVKSAYDVFAQSFIAAKGDAAAIENAKKKFTDAVRTYRTIVQLAIRSLP